MTYGVSGAHVLVTPPFIITKEQMDEFASSPDKSLESVERQATLPLLTVRRDRLAGACNCFVSYKLEDDLSKQTALRDYDFLKTSGLTDVSGISPFSAFRMFSQTAIPMRLKASMVHEAV